VERFKSVEAIARALGLAVRIPEGVGSGNGRGWIEGSDINFGWLPTCQPCPFRNVEKWVWKLLTLEEVPSHRMI